MEKKTITLYLALFLMAAILIGTSFVNLARANDTAIISIDSTTQQFASAQIGDTIQVEIDVSNVQNLWAWDIANLKFDPAVLNLTQVSEGPFLHEAGQTMFLWTSQSTLAISEGDIPDISCTLLVPSNANGSGVIAILSFEVMSLNETSQIAFNQTTLLNPNQGQIPSEALNSEITIGSVVPEFSSLPILLSLIMAATISILLFSRKAKRNEKYT